MPDIQTSTFRTSAGSLLDHSCEVYFEIKYLSPPSKSVGTPLIAPEYLYRIRFEFIRETVQRFR